jgi:hypothetical protein
MFLGIVSGFAIMGASTLLVGGAFRAVSGGREATEKEGKIMITLIAGIWLVLWLNGSSGAVRRMRTRIGLLAQL